MRDPIIILELHEMYYDFGKHFSYVGVALGDSWISPEDFVVCNVM